ncbi:hypothetical protein SAMN02910264_00198 [Ruminococcaceae bacterium YAD3003]|nr:hypothetical protein SAMN02910264_00198 [Ruminococcaceae bacterium YAD3003]
MRKILAVILGLSMLLGIASCGKKVEVPSKRDVKAVVEEEYDMEFKCESQDIADDEKSAEWVFLSEDGSLEVTVTWSAKDPESFEFDEEEHPEATETEPSVETETETSETETDATTTTTSAASSESSANGSSAAPAAGGTYVNFDEMNFYINGKKYTLGKTTLQEMIDDGVPFKAADLEDAGNNLKANYQSSGFRIELGEYYTAQVYVLNYSDEGKPMNECVVNEIYLPYSADKDTGILTFDFPLNMTADDLVANSGMPNNDIHHYEDGDYTSDTYKYTAESEIYISGSRYQFEFVRGELEYIYITWMP